MQDVNKDKLSYCQALNSLKDHGYTSSEDLAMVLGCSIRNVDRKLDFTDPSEFKGSELIKVSRHLSRIGQNQLALLMLNPKYSISFSSDAKANGIIDDEITQITVLAGQLAVNHRDRNIDQGLSTIRELRKQLDNAQLELKSLRG